MILYLVTNRVNGKIYVGTTRMKLRRRWLAHCRNALSGSPLVLHCAIRKYGVQNFDILPLADYPSLEDLNIAEINTIQALRSNQIDVGYNRTDGGENGGTFLGRKHSLETRLKMSARAKGKVFSDETRRKMSEAWKHRTVSKETRLRMSIAHRGLEKSESHRRHISEAQTGKKRSAETVAKMSASLKGRKAWNKGLTMSPEYREAARQRMLGKCYRFGYKHSPETLAKLKIAARNRPPRIRNKFGRFI